MFEHQLASQSASDAHAPVRGQVLITGGAGFIGSHLADELLAAGYRVRALDNLSPQVHGEEAHRQRRRPDYLDPRVELLVGDVCDRRVLREALAGADFVVHLAAAVGVGQSMYALEHYTRANELGTAVLLEALIERPVRKLLVASSMSIYGEGLYRDSAGRLVHNARRSIQQLKARRWEPLDASGRPLEPAPTDESKCPELASIYALGKYAQERMCLITGAAYGLPATALRFFNVYGPRQALSNPYTGVLAIFAGRLLNDAAPLVYEDGRQQRDFVHVRDVTRCCRLALESPRADGEVLNVGSGNPRNVRNVAQTLAAVLGRQHLRPQVTGKYRVGDIRHCFADISKARRLLGYEPAVAWEEGIAELAEWVAGQRADDHLERATAELARRGLAV